MLTHLIVDGYNVLHAWAQPGRGRGASPSAPAIDLARIDLLRSLELAAAQHACHCTVVFDGAPIEDLTHGSSRHLTVLFAGPRDTADTLIERLVCQSSGTVPRRGAVPSARPNEIVVATDDHLERDLVSGWGAAVWSSRRLAAWLTEGEP